MHKFPARMIVVEVLKQEAAVLQTVSGRNNGFKLR